MTAKKWLSAAIVLAVPLLAAAPGNAADFYQGKTLSLIVGYSPGGGSDLMCRLFARHLENHIAGKPTVVVKNMPGGGGLKAMNYVGEAVKPDGMTALCGAFNTLVQLLDDPALRVDLSKFNFVAGMGASQVFMARADIKPGIKKPEDIFKAEGVIIGGFRTNSSKDLLVRPAMDLLGVKNTYVTGVAGDGGGRKHVQQGFLNTWQDSLAGYISISKGTLIDTGVAVPIFQMGEPDANGKLSKRNDALPDIPTFFELYKAHFGKEPSGSVWDIYATMATWTAESLRAMSLPPKSPPEAVAAMRKGYADMLGDDAFWTEAHKVLGETAKLTKGEAAQKAIETTLGVSADFKKFLVKYIAEGDKIARKAQ